MALPYRLAVGTPIVFFSFHAEKIEKRWQKSARISGTSPMVLLIDGKDRLCVSISRFLLSPPHLLLLRSLNLRSMIRSHSHKRLSKCHPLIFRVRTTAYNSSAEPRRSDRPPRMERHERTHARMQSVVVVFSPALIVAGRAFGRRKNITSLLQTDPGSMGEKKKINRDPSGCFLFSFSSFPKSSKLPNN